MLKKTLLALSVAWTGSAMAASSSLDEVTMNIVNETAFEQIITADPAEIAKLLQANTASQPVRTIVLRNGEGTLSAGTPIEGQVFTVSKELNQGMVAFSFVCSEQEACQKRVEELNSANGFTMSIPAGAGGQPAGGFGVHVIGSGDAQNVTIVEGAPLDPGAIVDGALAPAQVMPFDGVVGSGAIRVNPAVSGQ